MEEKLMEAVKADRAANKELLAKTPNDEDHVLQRNDLIEAGLALEKFEEELLHLLSAEQDR